MGAESSVRCPWPTSHYRELHRHVLMRIELALGERSWSWLARETGVPQSTLASQLARPKFSLDILVRVASALDRDVSYFLPRSNESGSTSSDEALAQIAAIILRAHPDSG